MAKKKGKKGRTLRKPWEIDPASIPAKPLPPPPPPPAKKPAEKLPAAVVPPQAPGAVEEVKEVEKSKAEDVFDYSPEQIDEVEEPGFTKEKLSALTMKELRALGKELGVTARTKKSLISLILKESK